MSPLKRLAGNTWLNRLNYGTFRDVGKSKFVSSDWLLMVFLSATEAGLNWIKGHTVCICVYTLCHEA